LVTTILSGVRRESAERVGRKEIDVRRREASRTRCLMCWGERWGARAGRRGVIWELCRFIDLCWFKKIERR